MMATDDDMKSLSLATIMQFNVIRIYRIVKADIKPPSCRHTGKDTEESLIHDIIAINHIRSTQRSTYLLSYYVAVGYRGIYT